LHLKPAGLAFSAVSSSDYLQLTKGAGLTLFANELAFCRTGSQSIGALLTLFAIEMAPNSGGAISRVKTTPPVCSPKACECVFLQVDC